LRILVMTGMIVDTKKSPGSCDLGLNPPLRRVEETICA
jgi:hypothetical protein